MIRTWHAVAGTFIAGAIGAVVLAAPASAADVTVSPDVAPRGGPAELSFRIPEERPGAHTTKLELIPPAATPIAEVYPMSVAGWAPITRTSKLAAPIDLIHGTSTTHVVSSITWRRTKSAPAPKPGDTPQLTVSLGPMPQAEKVTFTLVQTYSDGTVVRWGDSRPGPVVRLISTPDAGHHGANDQAGAGSQAEDELFAAGSADSDGSSSTWLLWTLAAVLLLGLTFSAEALALFAIDRRATPAVE